jgi:hypothetical protein
MAVKNVYADVNFNKNQLLAARYENTATFPTGPAPGQVFFNTSDNKFYGWNGTTWIDLSQVMSAPTTVRGEIANASANPSFPANPTTGDTYFVTSTAGTIGGLTVEVGDQLVRSASSWFVLQANLQSATQALAGFVRLATQAEANAGADLTTAISPGTLATFLLGFLYARKFRVTLTSLTAATPTTITHGLNVANVTDVIVSAYQGGAAIVLDIKPTTVNALTVESNQTLGNVTIVVQG